MATHPHALVSLGVLCAMAAALRAHEGRVRATPLVGPANRNLPKFFKNARQDGSSVDVRPVSIAGRADRQTLALKILKRSQPSLDEEFAKEAVFDYGGERATHEVAMYRYMADTPKGQKYLVDFADAGTVGVHTAKNGNLYLNLLSIGAGHEQAVEYHIPCDDVVYAQSDCEYIRDKWLQNSHGAVFMMTEVLQDSMDMKRFVQRLLDAGKHIADNMPQDAEGIRQRQRLEIAGALQACQRMLQDLYRESGFVHGDYHLANMLIVVPPESQSLIFNKQISSEPFPAFEPGKLQAKLFDLDYSFVSRQDGGVFNRREYSPLVPASVPVLNVPIIQTLPVLDADIPRSTPTPLNRLWKILSSAAPGAAESESGVPLAYQLLHAADFWMGAGLLMEFMFECGEREMARSLLPADATAVPSAAAVQALLAPHWKYNLELVDPDYKQLVDLLHQASEIILTHPESYGSGEGQHAQDFGAAHFRILLVIRAALLDRFFSIDAAGEALSSGY